MDKRYEIECIAYDLYQKSGCIPGRELDNWLEAERIVCLRHPMAESSIEKKITKSSVTKKKTDAKQSKTSLSGKVSGKTGTKSRGSRTGSNRKEASL